MEHNKVKNMSNLFYRCSKFITLPDISIWNTSNVNDMSGIFYRCSSLKSLPDISKWDTKNVSDINRIFYGCSSLKLIPDISKWNSHNFINMSYMFGGCTSLISLPDISKWTFKKNENINLNMFYECSNLESLPDISKWDTTDVTDMSVVQNVSAHAPVRERPAEKMKVGTLRLIFNYNVVTFIFSAGRSRTGACADTFWNFPCQKDFKSNAS